jgi:hypothetical protein
MITILKKLLGTLAIFFVLISSTLIFSSSVNAEAAVICPPGAQEIYLNTCDYVIPLKVCLPGFTMVDYYCYENNGSISYNSNLCPPGYTSLGGTSCKKPAIPLPQNIEISSLNIDYSVVNCSSYTVLIGDTIECTYKLKGSVNNFYVSSATPITASISTASGYSWGCSIENNGTINASLLCKNIPTLNANSGAQTLALSIDPTNGVQLTLKEKPPVATEITSANLDQFNSKCDNLSLFIGEETTCKFKLSGSKVNWYTNTVSSITASISTSTATSYGCYIVDNQLPTVYLLCPKVPSTNATTGNQSVKTNLAGDNTNIPIDIKIQPPVATVITEVNTKDGTCNKDILIKGKLINTCAFPLTGAANNNYALPTNGIQAKLINLTDLSQNCEIINNMTKRAKLLCYKVPTKGASFGMNTATTNLVGETSKANVSLI